MTTKKTKPADEAVASTEAAESKPAVKATRPARGGKARTAGETPLKAAKAHQRLATPDGEAKAERNARADTKQAKLIAMLHTKHGATVDEIASAFGWQAHTVRGALYGALEKKLGLDISSEKVESRGRVYRIGS